MMHRPTFGGAGKKPAQFQTRMPVGKLGNKFKGIPRLGIPTFGNKPIKVPRGLSNTPAFRGPAKLPSNFMKNIPNLGISEGKVARAQSFNGLNISRASGHVPRAGHKIKRSGRKKVKRKAKK